MKKLLKLCFKIALVLVILGVGAVVALRMMFPPEKLKAMALEYAKNDLQREISFDGISLNLVGVTLDNFAISENTTFKNGTFAKADKLVVKIALKPLFKKRVEIATVQLDGLDVNVIKNKNGSFNFDSLIRLGPGCKTGRKSPDRLGRFGLCAGGRKNRRERLRLFLQRFADGDGSLFKRPQH